MRMYLRIVNDSIAQAWGQMVGNKLRTFLSLLGITIGIFCIISVLSSVESLEQNIRSSFERLGDDVLYVNKFPWAEDPGMNYWKYSRRPNLDYSDYQAVHTRMQTAGSASLSTTVGMRTLKQGGNNTRAFVIAVTERYEDILSIELEDGRFFTLMEHQQGTPRAVIGYDVAENIFVGRDPIGQTIKMGGLAVQVIGIIQRSGNDLINPVNFDRGVLITHNFGRRIANLNATSYFGTQLIVKAGDEVSIEDLRDELTSTLRAHRRLKPLEDDNFSINELSLLTNILNNFFGILNLVGIVIGGFAILVGIFSVANIMFVSVRERTNIIGIKKALGATRSVLLFEILLESIILCLIGGIIGLLFVFGALQLIGHFLEFEMILTFRMIFWGVSLSVLIGVLSGIIPAFVAAKMDPVKAIRG
nr:ABC transporter permease [Saprospiraceae bacterium]